MGGIVWAGRRGFRKGNSLVLCLRHSIESGTSNLEPRTSGQETEVGSQRGVAVAVVEQTRTMYSRQVRSCAGQGSALYIAHEKGGELD